MRLDSGNPVELSQEVRRRLDQGGLKRTRIFVTSDLDEYVITEMLARGAQVDASGGRNSLATSKDAPALGGVYKLVDVYSVDGPSPRVKLSGGKISYPGCKQIFRREGEDGRYKEDLVARCTEDCERAAPLLACVMRNGKRIEPAPTIDRVRQHARKEVGKLPASCRRLQNPVAYPVRLSHELQVLLKEFRARAGHETGRIVG